MFCPEDDFSTNLLNLFFIIITLFLFLYLK